MMTIQSITYESASLFDILDNAAISVVSCWSECANTYEDVVVVEKKMRKNNTTFTQDKGEIYIDKRNQIETILMTNAIFSEARDKRREMLSAEPSTSAETWFSQTAML